MNRLAWAAAALGATAFLVALAFTGGRGGPGLAPFVPRGLMTIPVEDVREIDVAAPRGHWHFVRTQGGWRATQGQPLRVSRCGSTTRSGCCAIRGRTVS